MSEDEDDSCWPLERGEHEVLRQLFMNGPTFDGDIISKPARNQLIEWTLACRHRGWTILTLNGLRRAIKMGLDDEKQKKENRK